MRAYARCVLAWVLGASLPSQATPQLPTGFVDEVLSSSLAGPIDLDFLPDGRLLFVEQSGRVAGFLPGAVGATPFVLGTVPNLTVSYSRGLLACAVDPEWPHRPFLYGWHTHGPTQTLRLTRFEITGALTDATATNLQMGAAYTVLSAPDLDAQHNGAFLGFGPDGLLYLATGDDKAACNAQDPASLDGKVLRMDVSALPMTGSGPATEAMIAPANPPFPNAPLIWATGLRNPFRGHVDPIGGRLIVADVGEAAFDELDVITQGGANLGWPWFEANAPFQTCPGGAAPTQLAPVFTLPLTPGVFTALVSLGVYRNRACGAPSLAPANFGVAYEGDVFCVDHFAGAVYRLQESAGAWAAAAPVPGQSSAQHWATGLDWAVGAATGPEGALYWVERRNNMSGAIHRVRRTGVGATFGYLGSGCVDARLSGSDPVLGQTFAAQVEGLPAATPFAALVLGFDALQGPLGPLPEDLTAFGLTDCLLRVAPSDTLPLTPLALPSGGFGWSVGLPLSPALLGQRFFLQGLGFIPGSTPSGFVLTDAGGGVIG